ncbi:hypothetical protein [Jongsikchunia kroppenstedtii]|uniref:hypothetical protein n=1 Tax=Jongsikchunia kroppenstedtii TaxID=1121721 RepID=UPI000379DDDD|nr:hypothetical protein [Jongsikchunia kroppenstedtii]
MIDNKGNPLALEYAADRAVADARAAVSRAKKFAEPARSLVYRQAVFVCLTAGLERRAAGRELDLSWLEMHRALGRRHMIDADLGPTRSRVAEDVRRAWL